MDVTRQISSFVRELRSSIERHGLFAPGSRVVLGVSGGADSIAMLHGLAALARQDDFPLALHVAHLNHGIRAEEAEADETFVREQAASLGVPCSVERVDVPAEAARQKVSIEEAARFARYAFFERVCLQADAKTVAVAHHADDNAETMVHRVFRGTGLRGLSGIRPLRRLSPQSDVVLVRPMLSMRRGRIEAFLTDAGLAWRHDSTNDATKMTRNRIRHDVIPLIEQVVNPQAVDALMRLAAQAAAMDEYLSETAERVLESVIVDRDGDGLALDASVLTRKRWIVQCEVIRLAIRGFGIGEQDLGYRHVASVAELAADPTSGKVLHLPGNLHATKSYGRLILARPTDDLPAPFAEVALTVPGRTVLPEQHLEIEATTEPVGDGAAVDPRTQRTNGEEWLDWDALSKPLMVRAPRAGDRFQPLGMTSDKKVAEFLVDEKVPKTQRRQIAVLCDQTGPVWVIPVRIDERARVTDRTRTILRLRVRS